MSDNDAGLAPEFDTEEVQFRKDGTIVWKVDGQRSVLRRPKFKELRTLREEINDLSQLSRDERAPLIERLTALTKPLTDQIDALDVEEGDPAAVARIRDELAEVYKSDEWIEVQDALKQQREQADGMLLEWFRDSILVRLGKPVVHIDDPEDLPPWVIDQTFIREVLEHWSSVPRRPGVV